MITWPTNTISLTRLHNQTNNAMNNQAQQQTQQTFDYTSHHEGIEQVLANLHEWGMVEAIKTFKARRAQAYRDMIEAGGTDPAYHELLDLWEAA